MSKSILVTGIGGGVGQGIAKNICAHDSSLRIVGTNTTYLTAGNHLCDKVFEVPYAEDNSYIETIKEICVKENISLVIPSTDAEIVVLAKHKDELPVVAASPAATCEIFFNKYKTWETFNGFGIPFAETVLPSNYKNNFHHNIVKPINGRGSRNIFVDHDNPTIFDDNFVVQNRHIGTEITTAFYITKENTLLGLITFERELMYGMTGICQTTQAYDKDLIEMINKLIQHITIRGSCNIQAIVEEKSREIIPFEINGRISGTNSIRSQFGFTDVVYTLQEYLYGVEPDLPAVTQGSAMRYVIDIIYPNKKLQEINTKDDKFYYSI